MHFQIYIPGAADLAPELTRVGLGDFVSNAEPLRVGEGPDGKAGCVFAWWNRQARQIGYRPAEQTWIASQCGRYWTGVWNADHPTPEECVRAHEAGKRMRLGNGEWLIPSLPMIEKEMVIGADGAGAFRVPKRFDALIEMVLRWREKIIASPTFRLTDETYWEMFDLALAALKLNYRMTREAALSMALFSTRTVFDAFNVVTGDLVIEGAGDGK